jgi:hypothetical protein
VPGQFTRDNLGQSTRQGVSDWISLNPLDGSWSLDDPNNVIASASVSNTGIRLQNAAAAYDHHHVAADDTGACYYKLLTNSEGKPMLFSDPGWNIDILIKRQTNGDDSGQIGVYVCDDPTDRTNRNWLGVTCSNMANGAGKWYVGTQNGENSGANAASDRILCSISNPIDTSGDDDGNEITHNITYMNLNSSLAALQQGSKNNNTQEYDQGDMVYIMLASAFDTESNSEPGANSDNTWKVWYRVNWSPQGIDPQYLLAGRTADNL